MPIHGPPGDRHNLRGGRGSPFAGFLDQIIPAIGTTIGSFNRATQPIRDFYNPVLGLGQQSFRRAQDFYGDAAGLLPQEEIGQGIGQGLANFQTAFGDFQAAPFGRTGGGSARTVRQAVLGDQLDLDVANRIEEGENVAADLLAGTADTLQTAFGEVPAQILETLFTPTPQPQQQPLFTGIGNRITRARPGTFTGLNLQQATGRRRRLPDRRFRTGAFAR